MLAGPLDASSELPPKQIPIRLTTALVAILLAAGPPLVAQLPPEIELDRLMLKLETAIAGEDLMEALVTTRAIEELHDEHGVDLPHEYRFLKARHYLTISDHHSAIQVVSDYLMLAGREGEHYREALALLNRAERDLAIAEAKAEREREEKEGVEQALAGMQFVRIPAGEFMRQVRGEAQRVRITVPFDMGKHEVTQEQWQAVMGTNPSEFSGCGHCPVENVSWDDVYDFILKVRIATGSRSYRLPTQAEWEHAARAGTQGEYPGGFDWDFVYAAGKEGRVPPLFDAVAWHEGNSGGRTHPVGEKTPNAWGLHDMHGNVSEWTQTWSGWYEDPPALLTDPEGPAGGSHKEIEGCSWEESHLRCSFKARKIGNLNSRSKFAGFRLARTVNIEDE